MTTAQSTALFQYPEDIAKFRLGSLAPLSSMIEVDSIEDDDVWGALVAAEAEASHALRVFFKPTVIIPEDSPQSEIDALEAAGTAYSLEPAYDYHPYEWTMDQWGHIALRQKPIISVQSVKFTYPSATNQVLDVPLDWLRLDKKYGQVRFVPTGTMMGMGPLSSYMLQAMSSGRLIPNMIHIRYTAGLADPKRDFPDLVTVVKRMAAMKIIKASFLPQSGSISADGLSQSASIDVDKWQDGIDRDLGALRDLIHGVRFGVL